MITGDSVLTGIHIARQSGMIKNNTGVVFLGQCTEENSVEWVDVDDSGSILATESILKAAVETKAELAISGQAWSILRVRDPVLAHRIAKHIRVFGRCSPSDKVSIVSNFNEQGNVTLMCGDGQNDCGALRTAHVGIALSASEASVVAPLTSLDKTIASVSYVVREGRCALASTLAAYSFYLVYGQTETFLQTIASYFAILFFEWNWLFLDCIWTISLAFSIPLAKAAAKLSRRWPTSSLLGDETLVSICGIIAVNFLFMIGALITLWNQDWFKCRKWDPDGIGGVFIIGDNYEASVLFLMGGFQYVASAMALNFGYTFRQGWWKNYTFVLFALTWCCFIFFMTVYPSSFSCIVRVNCSNEVCGVQCVRKRSGSGMSDPFTATRPLQNVVRGAMSREPIPISNPFNTTVMPVGFRWILVIIMAANLVSVMLW
jgi:magnesium-transporting ATPase (P-type)